jgi:hypothetical protein
LRAGNHDSEEAVSIESHEHVLQVAGGTQLGLTQASQESGLAGDDLELTAALRIALEVPDAGARWLAGEAVFAAALHRD